MLLISVYSQIKIGYTNRKKLLHDYTDHLSNNVIRVASITRVTILIVCLISNIKYRITVRLRLSNRELE